MLSLKKRTFIKVTALLVSIIFFQQQILWSEEGTKLTWSSVMGKGFVDDIAGSAYEIPYKYASMEEVYDDGSDTRIIQIQDAHASLSAQYSIVELLDGLLSKHDMDLIAIEGGSGYIDTSFLRSFPIEKIRKDKAESLLKQGLMGAGEFFSVIKNDEDIAVYGVEDEALYWQNVKEFREVSESRDVLVRNVDALMDQLTVLAQILCSEELREFNKVSFLHRDSKISFMQYWEKIELLLKEFDITTEQYKETNKLAQAIALEKKIDFTAANIERRDLIADLNGKLNKNELEALVLNAVMFREGRLSNTAFHEYLVALAEEYYIPSDAYQNLIMFSEYINIYENLNIVSLRFELEALENNIRKVLYRNNDEYELYEMFVLAYLLRKLYTVELIDTEYDTILSNENKYNTAFFKAFIDEYRAKYGMEGPVSHDMEKIISGIDKALAFYRTARERDRAMISNTINKMRAEGKKVAALITGGFHRDGLTRIMKDKKISYLVVSPKCVTNEQRPYFAVLTGKNKVYTDILNEKNYNIAVFDFSSNQTPGEMKEEAFYLLAKARIVQGADPRKVGYLWKEQYRALQDIKDSFPSRKIAPVMTAGQFEDMIDSIEIKMIGAHAIVFSGRKPAAAFKRDNSGLDVEKVRISRKMLADINNVFITETDQEKTLLSLTAYPEGIERLISKYKDPNYFKNIAARLNGTALRKEISSDYVLRILKRDGLLPQDWSKSRILVDEINALIDRVQNELKEMGTIAEKQSVQHPPTEKYEPVTSGFSRAYNTDNRKGETIGSIEKDPAKQRTKFARANSYIKKLKAISISAVLTALFAGSVLAGEKSAKSFDPDSTFGLVPEAAFLFSVIVTSFFVVNAVKSRSELRKAKAKDKLRDAEQKEQSQKTGKILSLERRYLGSMIGAAGMMLITFVLGASLPETGTLSGSLNLNLILWYTGIPQVFILVALIGVGLGIKKKWDMFSTRLSTRHIKDTGIKGMNKSGRGVSGEKQLSVEAIQTVIGMPLEVYNFIGSENIKRIATEIGVDNILPVDSGRKDYLDKFRRENGTMVGVYLDIDVFNDYILYEDVKTSDKVRAIRRKDHPKMEIMFIDIDAVKKDMFLLVSKAMKDLIRIMEPEKSALNFEDVRKQIKKVGSEDDIMKIVTFYARLLPDIESVDLFEKSAYALHFDRLNDKVFNDIKLTGRSRQLLADNFEKDNPEYISLEANSASDLRLIASAIKKAGLTKTAAQKFINIRMSNSKITENNIERVLESTGLSSYLPRANISLVKKDMTLSETLELVKGVFDPGIENRNIAIGSYRNIVTTDKDERIIRSQSAPVLVEMRGKGLASQMLWILIEVLAHRGDPQNIPAALGDVKLMKGQDNWYIYLPNIVGVDLEELRKDIENYEKMLIAA